MASNYFKSDWSVYVTDAIGDVIAAFDNLSMGEAQVLFDGIADVAKKIGKGNMHMMFMNSPNIKGLERHRF